MQALSNLQFIIYGENMRKSLIALVSALALSSAAVAGDVYVNGGVGKTVYNFNDATDNQSGTAWFGGVGYIFDNNLGVEGVFDYTGEADLTDGVKSDNEYALKGYGVGRIPLDNEDKVNLVAKAGLGYNKQKIEGESDRNWYPALALGVEWYMTPKVAVVGMIDHDIYNFDDDGDKLSANPTTYKVGLQYKF